MFRQFFVKKFPFIKNMSSSLNTAGEIKNLVKSDRIVIFSKTFCPYCHMVKDVFQKMRVQYTCVELDQRGDGEEIQKILGEMTGARTVPRVFFNGTCLGGGSDVKELYDKGILHKVVSEEDTTYKN